jgi:hypothetical protein
VIGDIACFVDTPGNCTKIDDSSRPDCPVAIAFFNRLQNVLKNDDDQMVPLGEHPDTSAFHYWVKCPFAIITVNNGYGKGYCNNR